MRPAMLYNATRASTECTDMMAEMLSLAQLGSSLVIVNFTASKLRWLAKHQPELTCRIDKVVCRKDLAALHLQSIAPTTCQTPAANYS